MIITTLEAKQRGGKGEKEGDNVDVKGERKGGGKGRRRKRLPCRGKWKTKDERGGVGGWENRALSERQHCLIPLQGFKGALCVRARECMANGIFNKT